MPNLATYKKLLSSGYSVDQHYFDKNDSLETADDLSALFEVLTSVKDKNGHFAVITPLVVCANPDFERIANNNFEEYYYESLIDTYKRYNQINTYNILLEGIAEGIFCPQFHGREHIQVRRWMKYINSGDKVARFTFANQSLISSRNDGLRFSLNESCLPAFGYTKLNEIDELNLILKDGLRLFKDVYGYKATSMCPPCGVVNDSLLEKAKEYGITGLQAGQHFVPQKDGSLKRIDKFWGAKNKVGQIFWRRNCTFEPARDQSYDWVDHCLSEIEIAFRWNKPAVINSHRVNFIGTIFPENRSETLKQFSILLKSIVKRWPDVEFINSEDLLRIMIE